LQVDPGLDLDVLREKFSFEIVAEQEEGYVIVASEDIELAPFLEMVNGFAVQIYGSATVASVHRLFDDPNQPIGCGAYCPTASSRSGPASMMTRSTSLMSVSPVRAPRKFRHCLKRESVTQTLTGREKNGIGHRLAQMRTTHGTTSKLPVRRKSNNSSNSTELRFCTSSTAQHSMLLFFPIASRSG